MIEVRDEDVVGATLVVVVIVKDLVVDFSVLELETVILFDVVDKVLVVVAVVGNVVDDVIMLLVDNIVDVVKMLLVDNIVDDVKMLLVDNIVDVVKMLLGVVVVFWVDVLKVARFKHQNYLLFLMKT